MEVPGDLNIQEGFRSHSTERYASQLHQVCRVTSPEEVKGVTSHIFHIAGSGFNMVNAYNTQDLERQNIV